MVGKVAKKEPPPFPSVVLDSEGLWAVARNTEDARALIDLAIRGSSTVIVPAIVLAEALTGGPKDARVNQVLSKLTVVSITEDLARDAALLKRKSGMTGVQHTIDAIVVAVSASQGGGVVLTSDPGDIGRLADEVQQSRIRAIKV